MKIISANYDIEPINGFHATTIIQNGDDKFLIGFSTNKMDHYVECKNMIIGAWSYMKSKNDLENGMEYYESIDECERQIITRTPQNLIHDLNVGRIRNRPIFNDLVMAIKQ
jgi:hypothetical protein